MNLSLWPAGHFFLRAIGFLLLLCATQHDLYATAQTPEVLILEGKEEEMAAEPLEHYFEQGHPKPFRLAMGLNSALWRGYIGTWEIKDDELFLLSLRTEICIEEKGKFKSLVEDFPLNVVFPGRKGPIKATWFSDVINIRKGKRLRYVHMGYGSIFEKALYLTIKKGKVVARREVDNTEEGATRSDADLSWVAISEHPAPDDGKWIDARTIRAQPPKGTFKTRGIFMPASEESPAALWIPETPTTEEIILPLKLATPPPRPNQAVHMEITGSFPKDLTPAIRVDFFRELKSGETIHHRDYTTDQSPELRKQDAEIVPVP